MDYKIFLKKARENLAAAETCCEHGYFNASTTRAYFAMFQAAIAVLSNKGITSRPGTKSHSWVQAMVSQRLTKQQKVMSHRFSSYLPEAQINRNHADYGLIEISKSICYRQLNKSREFLETVWKEIPNASQPQAARDH